jgi:hypothetical protein
MCQDIHVFWMMEGKIDLGKKRWRYLELLPEGDLLASRLVNHLLDGELSRVGDGDGFLGPTRRTKARSQLGIQMLAGSAEMKLKGSYLSPRPFSTASICLTMSRPSRTFPKTTCLPSNLESIEEWRGERLISVWPDWLEG